MQTAAIALLAALCAFLLLQQERLRREVNKICDTAKQIRLGNFNQRFRLLAARKEMEDCGAELNRLADFFQNSLERTRFLEKERSRMISDISHDLRTPLTSLLGYVEALRDDASLTGTEREDFLRIVAEKGDRLSRLIQAFFEMAKLEEEEEPPVLQRLDLAEALRTALLGFYPDFTRLAITPAVEIPDRPVWVTANPDDLQRVLNNLLTNALRYGSDGKEIGAAIRVEGEVAWTDIRDSGRGIAEKDLPHIFDRLYTAETSRNIGMRGTGLGLAIAKKLAERQGGRIAAESIPCEKTVFSFCLPLENVRKT